MIIDIIKGAVNGSPARDSNAGKGHIKYNGVNNFDWKFEIEKI